LVVTALLLVPASWSVADKDHAVAFFFPPPVENSPQPAAPPTLPPVGLLKAGPHPPPSTFQQAPQALRRRAALTPRQWTLLRRR